MKKNCGYIIGTIAFGKGGEDLVGSCPRHLKGKNGNFEFSFDSSDNSLDFSEEEGDGGQKDEEEEVRLVSTRSPSKNQEPKSTISQKLNIANIGKLIFHSFQHITHLLCKFGHF